MSQPNKHNFLMLCVASFDYLSAARLYHVNTEGQYWFFRDEERESGTFIPAWKCESQLKLGGLVSLGQEGEA